MLNTLNLSIKKLEIVTAHHQTKAGHQPKGTHICGILGLQNIQYYRGRPGRTQIEICLSRGVQEEIPHQHQPGTRKRDRYSTTGASTPHWLHHKRATLHNHTTATTSTTHRNTNPRLQCTGCMPCLLHPMGLPAGGPICNPSLQAMWIRNI